MFNNIIDGTNQSPKLNFGLKDTHSVHCIDCKGEVFQNGIIFRRVSKLIAGTDKDALVPLTVPYCVNCLTPLEDLLPSELRKTNLNLIQ